MFVCCNCGSMLAIDRDFDDEVKYRRMISEHELYSCSNTLSNDDVSLTRARPLQRIQD